MCNVQPTSDSAGLLHDIRNMRDPEGWDKLSDVGAGFCAGAATGLGALITIPIWWGGLFGTVTTIALPATQAVRDALHEDPPRILCSNERERALWDA